MLKYLILFIILFNTLIFSDYWVRQQTPGDYWLYRCDFVDSSYGWAVGDSGIVLNTTNSGTNWFVQPTNTYDFLVAVHFINRTTGWIIGNSLSGYPTSILKTTNGGINWNYTYYPDSNTSINYIYFEDPQTGWMAGYNGYILNTTNGGTSWNKMELDTSLYQFFPVRFIDMYNVNSPYGLATGGIYDYGGVIWRTTNYGNFWKSTLVGSEPIFGLIYKDSLNVLAMGGDFEFGTVKVVTTDGGERWEYIILGFFGVAQTVKQRTSLEYWCPLGFSQRMIYTLDGGETWTEWFLPDTTSSYFIDFTDSLHGWSVGSSGRIYRYNTGLFGIDEEKNLVPTSVKLYQNYPNPFNPVTTISFYLPKAGIAEIIIYDLTGREADRVKIGYTYPGERKVTYDASKLASGVYYYKLRTEDFSAARKMVVLK